MGLLDDESTRTALGLLAAAGPSATPQSFGQRLMGGLLQSQQIGQQQKEQEAAARMREIQRQQHQMQMAQMQRAAEQQKQQDAFRMSLPSPQMQGVQGALAGNGGPTNAAAAAIPQIDPNAQMLHGAMRAGLIDPVQYMTAIQKDNSPINVAAGGALLDRKTYKPLFVNPKEDATPPELKEYNFAVLQGEKRGFTEWKTALKRAGATAITVDQRGDNEYSKDQGKQYSDLMGGINKAGFSAPSQIRKLERMDELLKGVDGGRLAPVGLDIASVANSFGIKMDPRLGNKEAAQALSRELAGGLRQPGTGPMTDKDFENFLQQIPDLSKSAAGRTQITTTMKAALNRDVKVSQMARDYERKHGRIDGGFMDEVATFIAENPVVGEPAGWKVKR